MAEGVTYVSSWVDDKFERCYQLMETHDRRLLNKWMSNWHDLVEFDAYPVMTSKEAAERSRQNYKRACREAGRIRRCAHRVFTSRHL
jgi:hypothetical protein